MAAAAAAAASPQDRTAGPGPGPASDGSDTGSQADVVVPAAPPVGWHDEVAQSGGAQGEGVLTSGGAAGQVVVDRMAQEPGQGVAAHGEPAC